MSYHDDNFTFKIVIGMIVTFFLIAAVVYGTLGAVIYHFVKKLLVMNDFGVLLVCFLLLFVFVGPMFDGLFRGDFWNR